MLFQCYEAEWSTADFIILSLITAGFAADWTPWNAAPINPCWIENDRLNGRLTRHDWCPNRRKRSSKTGTSVTFLCW